MIRLFKGLALALALCLACWAPAQGAGCQAVYGSGPRRMAVATGSPGELGLLQALAKDFLARHPGASICWKKAGSGASLRLLRNKQADVVLVHAPAAEKAAVAQGWAAERTLIGGNQFYIVGPKSDPAGIARANSAAGAYARIALARARFISRGDNSGTHKREMAIWRAAGVSPSGGWYLVSHDFMMASLRLAAARGAYFMTDSSTWVKGRAEHGLAGLAVLHRGDPVLVNTYHALGQPAGATPNAELGREFIRYLASPAGQKIIARFGAARFGQPLYLPAARARGGHD